MSRYPRTITNGAGESLTFLGHVVEGSTDRLLVENSVSPGAGPPMHVHWLQEESLTVVAGRIAYQEEGEEAKFAEVGETVAFEAGVPHRFWNPGDAQLVCRGWVSPAHNVEYFLSVLFDSTRENGGHRPHPADAAFLLGRYRSEFALTVIPAFVQRVVFPVQRLLGRITGRYERFKDAPEPVRR